MYTQAFPAGAACRGPWPYRFYEDFSGIQPELRQKSGGIRHLNWRTKMPLRQVPFGHLRCT